MIPARPQARPAHRLRALVVDDNRDAADTLAVLAGLWGYEARAVYDGPAALAAAAEAPPDCLFLDIAMPGMDGFELATRLRQLPGLQRAKLVALSAYSGDTHHRRVREAGFDYALTKPADPADLKRMFHMLAQALKLAEQNIELARETKDLLLEVKEELREVKADLQEVKDELKEVKADRP